MLKVYSFDFFVDFFLYKKNSRRYYYTPIVRTGSGSVFVRCRAAPYNTGSCVKYLTPSNRPMTTIDVLTFHIDM